MTKRNRDRREKTSNIQIPASSIKNIRHRQKLSVPAQLHPEIVSKFEPRHIDKIDGTTVTIILSLLGASIRFSEQISNLFHSLFSFFINIIKKSK